MALDDEFQDQKLQFPEVSLRAQFGKLTNKKLHEYTQGNPECHRFHEYMMLYMSYDKVIALLDYASEQDGRLRTKPRKISGKTPINRKTHKRTWTKYS